MNLPFNSYQLWDLLSFLIKIGLILWFFKPVKANTEGRFRWLGYLCLLSLAWLYLSPTVALTDLYSAKNFVIQTFRMLTHWLPICLWLLLVKDITFRSAAYLSGIATVVFLATQNLRTSVTLLVPILNANEAYRRFTLFFVILVEWLVLYVVRSAMKIDKVKRPTNISIGVLVLSILLEVYFKWSLVAMQFVQQPSYTREFAVFALIAAVSSMALPFLVEKSQQRQQIQLKMQGEQIAMAYEMQNAKRSQQANNDIRRLYHDMKNHLLIIQSMAGEKEELKEYLNELLPQFEDYETQISTGNAMLDTLLSEKMQRASLDQIQFNVCLNMKELDHLLGVDLVTIFGNAVDNAIEAVQKLPKEEERVIYIKSSEFANMHVLRFSNRYYGEVEILDGNIVTSKSDSDFHGIGLSSVRHAVARYNGYVTLNADNEQGEFVLTIMLPAKN